MDEHDTGIWYSYDDGRSIGQTGWEGGVILRDEELGDPDDPEDADARVTLERVAAAAEMEGAGDSFALTCNLYGLLAQTFTFAGEAAAQGAFEAAKKQMERLAELIPYEDDSAAEVERKARALEDAARTLPKSIGVGTEGSVR